MIEVEIKYKLKSDNWKKIFKNTENSIPVNDVYYDTHDYSFFKGGNFVRLRNGKKVNLKLFAGDTTHIFCKEESFDLKDFNSSNCNVLCLLKELGIQPRFNFTDFYEFVEKYNLLVLCSFNKKRIIERKKNLIFSLDDVDNLGLFLEVEKDFNNNSIFDKNKAASSLKKILSDNKIIDCSIDEEIHIGYVELFLKENNYSLYLEGKYLD